MYASRQDKAQQAEVAQQLEEEYDWLEDNADQAGPYFLGAEFSLVVRRPPLCHRHWHAKHNNGAESLCTGGLAHKERYQAFVLECSAS